MLDVGKRWRRRLDCHLQMMFNVAIPIEMGGFCCR
jgi:hypothetical protein